jgi:hypothetical protein
LPTALPLPLPFCEADPSRVEQYGPPGHLPFAPPVFLSALLSGWGWLKVPDVPALPFEWSGPFVLGDFVELLPTALPFDDAVLDLPLLLEVLVDELVLGFPLELELLADELLLALVAPADEVSFDSDELDELLEVDGPASACAWSLLPPLALSELLAPGPLPLPGSANAVPPVPRLRTTSSSAPTKAAHRAGVRVNEDMESTCPPAPRRDREL